MNWLVALLALVAGGFVLAVRNTIAGVQRQTELKRRTLDWAAQVQARDPHTDSHSTRVSELAGRLGEHLELDKHEVELLRTAGSLHDLGMIGVRDDVLSKPGPLSAEEWEVIRRHPDIGADIIAQRSAFAEMVPLVRHHHERWDGTGYPVGLKGADIPLGARIIAVADSFDATTHYRVFRPNHLTDLEAMQDISEHSGSWYDPAVVDALRALYRLN